MKAGKFNSKETWLVKHVHGYSQDEINLQIYRVLEWIGGGWCLAEQWDHAYISHNRIWNPDEWSQHTGPVDPENIRQAEFYDARWKMEAWMEAEQRGYIRALEYYLEQKAEREAKCKEIRQVPLTFLQRLLRRFQWHL